MSTRERTLAIAVAAIVFLFVNFFVIDHLVTSRNRLSVEFASKRKQLDTMKSLTAERALWEQRAAWLDANQPSLGNPDSAGVQLLDQVKEAARKHTVLLDNPAIKTPARRLECVSVSVEIETKSSWKGLIAFLAEMQTPQQFIVFESANLKIDASDPTQMRGRLRIAKWYSPK